MACAEWSRNIENYFVFSGGMGTPRVYIPLDDLVTWQYEPGEDRDRFLRRAFEELGPKYWKAALFRDSGNAGNWEAAHKVVLAALD